MMSKNINNKQGAPTTKKSHQAKKSNAQLAEEKHPRATACGYKSGQVKSAKLPVDRPTEQSHSLKRKVKIVNRLSVGRAFSLMLLLSSLGSLANGTAHSHRELLSEYCDMWRPENRPCTVRLFDRNTFYWKWYKYNCRQSRQETEVAYEGLRQLYHEEVYDPIPDYNLSSLNWLDVDYESPRGQLPDFFTPRFIGPRLNEAAYNRLYNGRWQDADAIPAAEFDRTPEVVWVEYGPQVKPIGYQEPDSTQGNILPFSQRKPYAVIENDEPSSRMIGNREKRVFGLTGGKRGDGFKKYIFPYLDFIGFWDNSKLSPSGYRQIFNDEHFGVHLHKDNIEVWLPFMIVDECIGFWRHKEHDSEMKEFDVSVAKCRNLISTLDLSPAEYSHTLLYAPAIAYLKPWDTQQNVSRVIAGAHFSLDGLSKSWRRSSSTFYKFFGPRCKLVLQALVVLIFLSMCVHLVEPHLGIWCRLSSYFYWLEIGGVSVPFTHQIFPDLYYEPSCYANHYSKLWVFDHFTISNVKEWFGCTDVSPDFIVRSLTSGRGISINPSYLLYSAWNGELSCSSYVTVNVWHVSRKILNALMHALNGNRDVNFVNCADLPVPKQYKRGEPTARHPKGKLATVELRDGDLRKNIKFKTPTECRGRTGIYGFDTELYGPEAFASNQHNEWQALNARVLVETDKPTGKLQQCINWCKSNHCKLFPKMNSVKSVPFDVYLRRSNASPSVKRILQKTYDRMVKDGYDEDSILSDELLYKWTTRSSFVKVENNLYRTPLGLKDKAPRLIQGAQPEFIVIVGPWIMAMQDLLKRRWNGKKDFPIFFTSGAKSESLADFISDHDGKVLEDDLGKFDSSIRRPWCEYEVWLCKKFKCPRAVLDLMKANIDTHGYTLHGWKYACDGTRKSGDPYTSLMNSIINGLSHLYIYCEERHVSLDEAMDNNMIRMLVQGDDNILRHNGAKINFRPLMAELGFDSVAIYRENLHTAEFCSNRFYKLQRGWILGPKPGKVLAKFGYIVNPPKNVSRESMMRGVALGLRRNCNFIPPIRAVIDRVLELTEGHVAFYERKFLEHTVNVEQLYEPTIDVLVHLDEQYCWDTRKQKSFEATVSNMKLGDAYSDPYADLLFDRDTSGPQQVFGPGISTSLHSFESVSVGA